MPPSRVKTFGNAVPADILTAIGIDQSLTGFAIAVISITDPSQYVINVYKSGLTGVKRLVDIRDYLLQALEPRHIVAIAMEDTIRASYSASVLGELAGLVKVSLYDRYGDLGIPLRVPPTVLKRYTAGKGNAGKPEMLLQTYKRWHVELADDNAADAYGLARIAAGYAVDKTEELIIEQLKDIKFRDQ